MSVIRVLHIIDNINIDSGISSFVMNIYRHIDTKLIQFDFLVSHRGYERGKTYEEEIHTLGGKIFYFGTPLSIKGLVKSTIYAKKFFKENVSNYDIVHLHTPTIAKFTIKYAKRYGIKEIITHSHSTMTSTKLWKAVINSYLISCIKKYTNHFWACSTEAAEFLFGKEFCMRNKIEIVRNAIEPEKYAFSQQKRCEMRQKLSLDGSVVLVHVSNFSPIKNLSFMIPVIQKVIELKGGYRFLFVGDGPTKKSIEKELLRKGLFEHCVFVGQTDDVSVYLQAADAFFMPSLTEGFGVAAVEAQANGLKCLLSDTITREVNAGQVTFIPLKVELWVDIILNLDISSNLERSKNSENFTKSELNIYNEINHIQNLYIEIAKIKNDKQNTRSNIFKHVNSK